MTQTKSTFVTPLNVDITQRSQNGRTYVVLQKSFEYLLDYDTPAKGKVVVEAGFKTDFASVPRVFWPVFPPLGPWAKAAVVHDWLYSTRSIVGFNRLCTRREADVIFLNGMKVLGVATWKATALYLAVRAFGWWGWRQRWPLNFTVD